MSKQLDTLRQYRDQTRRPSHLRPVSKDVVLLRNSGSPSRLLTLVAFAFALGSILLLTSLLLGQDPPQTGPITHSERLIWAAGVCATFVLLFALAWTYERSMATLLTLVQDGRFLRVTTPTLLGERTQELPVSAVGHSVYHEGDWHGEEAAAGPWILVRAPGYRWFVVSLGGFIPNRGQLLQVLGARV